MYANRLPQQSEFFLYLLEQYARSRGLSAAETLARWDAAGTTARIRENYDIYHAEALENAFAEVDAMLAQPLRRRTATESATGLADAGEASRGPMGGA
jgi:hypothetical protein